jgi:succinate dehydrogenase / fumarate reductase membrane anchor subunit
MSPTFTVRWLIQAGLGIALILLLGIHLIVNHWAAPQGLLSHADVVQYYDLPGIAWMEAIFLIVVTVHCGLGLHSILLDLNLRLGITRAATWLLLLAGATAILYGIWLTWTVARQ